MRHARSPSGMGIPPRCISGGHGGRWRRVGRCSLAYCFRIPVTQNCPAEFKEAARTTLQELLGVREGDEGLRRALITFIGDVANWDVANHPRWISVARELVRAAHGDEPPFVVDPFAGGGSIPLEALRLGCDTFASDLNPVACLILKSCSKISRVMAPSWRQSSDGWELRSRRQQRRNWQSSIQMIPMVQDRSLTFGRGRSECEAPNCGAEIPLMRSFWFSKKANRRRALRPKIVRSNGESTTSRVRDLRAKARGGGDWRNRYTRQSYVSLLRERLAPGACPGAACSPARRGRCVFDAEGQSHRLVHGSWP